MQCSSQQFNVIIYNAVQNNAVHYSAQQSGPDIDETGWLEIALQILPLYEPLINPSQRTYAQLLTLLFPLDIVFRKYLKLKHLSDSEITEYKNKLNFMMAT